MKKYIGQFLEARLLMALMLLSNSEQRWLKMSTGIDSGKVDLPKKSKQVLLWKGVKNEESS